MIRLREVEISPKPISRFFPLLGAEEVQKAEKMAERLRRGLDGRVIWNVNSTPRGGGVAEMLPSLLGYTRGAGVDSRWLVIEGTAEFFRVTKRLHHALHGSRGDGMPLDKAARTVYEENLANNLEELRALVRPGDFVLLHDPQTAGLAPGLIRTGASVIWRCHIGQDEIDDEARQGWEFLAPYLENVPVLVFSRREFIPPNLDEGRSVIIPPSIDPFSAKNQDLSEETVRAILVHTGLVNGPQGGGNTAFVREDGSPGRVDHFADITRLGKAPAWETPLVVQVSRWDTLKDPVGVLRGFARYLD